jgi:hypothetical protein
MGIPNNASVFLNICNAANGGISQKRYPNCAATIHGFVPEVDHAPELPAGAISVRLIAEQRVSWDIAELQLFAISELGLGRHTSGRTLALPRFSDRLFNS